MCKKIFMLFVVCVFCLPQLFSQAKVNVDSLTAVLAQYPKDDTVKVDMLIKLVMAYRRKNTDKAVAYVEEALKISEQLQNEYWIGISYTMKSTISFVKGDLSEAQIYCEKAISFLEKGNKYPNDLADAIMFLGSIAITMGETSAALKHYETALATFEKTNNIPKQISTIGGLVFCYRQLGNNQKALELCLEGLKKNEIAPKNENLGLLYTQIAGVYKDMGNYVLSLDYRLKTMDLMKNTGNRQGLIIEYNGIADIYSDLKDNDEARFYFQKALDLARDLKDKRSTAATAINLSLAYDDTHKQIEELNKALVYCNEANNKSLQGYVFQNLCSCHMKIDDYRTAYHYLQKAFEIEKEVQDKNNFATINLNAADLFIKCSDEDLRNFGIEPNTRYEKAREFLEKVFSKDNGAPMKQSVSAWRNLSIIHEKQQNYALAYEAFHKYVTLKDSTAGDDIRKQITRKEIQYEFNKKETEFKYQQGRTADLLEQERLLTVQQSQTLLLNDQTLALREKDLVLSNRERDLTHLAFLKEQAEKQEKVQMLSLAEEREKGKELDLSLKNLALSVQKRQNLFLNVIAILLLLGLGAISYFYILVTKQKKLITQQNQINEHTIAILSHDIKAPLIGVKVMLKKLNTDDPFVAQASKSLEAQINSVNSVLNTLLSMKKLSMGKNDKDASAHVNAIIQNVLQVLSMDIQSKNLTIKNELTSDIFLPIAPEKLQFILHNLLSNAVKYSFMNQSIRIFQKGKGICIQDFGVGLSPEQSSKLMREVTTPQEGTNREKGNGMGLFLVGNALQNESVKLVFESPETDGTLVRLMI